MTTVRGPLLIAACLLAPGLYFLPHAKKNGEECDTLRSSRVHGETSGDSRTHGGIPSGTGDPSHLPADSLPSKWDPPAAENGSQAPGIMTGSDGSREAAPGTGNTTDAVVQAPAAARRFTAVRGTGSAPATGESAPAAPRMPAAMAVTPEETPLPDGAEEVLDELADEFSRQMEESGLATDSPEYAELWESAAARADHAFRARYGNRAWMRQHLEAHRQHAESGTP